MFDNYTLIPLILLYCQTCGCTPHYPDSCDCGCEDE